MSRVNRMQSGNSNPAAKFFQWKSDHQKFAYYDKAEEKNVFVEMPVKFLALVSYKCIKGFNSKKNTGISSNEVRSVGKDSKETLRVHFFDQAKTVIADGKWQDIKDEVDREGGKFTESVYAMLPDGELVNFQINGAGLSTWYEFQKNQSDKFFDTWIEVKSFKEGKQGKVDYTFPVFEWGDKLDRKEEKLASECDAKISTYEDSYFNGKPAAHGHALDGDRSNSAVNQYEEDRLEPVSNFDDLDI